jgi:hypothetical protein
MRGDAMTPCLYRQHVFQREVAAVQVVRGFIAGSAAERRGSGLARLTLD